MGTTTITDREAAGVAAASFEKLVLVTRKTRLQELVERFNTVGQARFYIEHAGGRFAEYVDEDDVYRRAVELAHRQVQSSGLKVQLLARELVPTYRFSAEDIVVVLGQDGLVANCAKYVGTQPIIGVNPDPARLDGVLLPFRPESLAKAVGQVAQGRARVRPVTLAEAVLNDGQRLLAFNELFVGAQTHVSARYRLVMGGREEAQSSSGILISTGAGSTGWLSSAFNMAAGLATFAGQSLPAPRPMAWEDATLLFVVREPFVSRHSKAGLVVGRVEAKKRLVVESLMSGQGVIFSDGIESDYLDFNAGRVATIGPAAHKAQLVAPAGR